MHKLDLLGYLFIFLGVLIFVLAWIPPVNLVLLGIAGVIILTGFIMCLVDFEIEHRHL